MRKKIGILAAAGLALAGWAGAQSPMETHFSMEECLGTYMPYAAPERAFALPDTLEAVFLDHVGRHGARFPTSDASLQRLTAFLEAEQATGNLSPEGQKALRVANGMAEQCRGEWGTLDSLGRAEQRGIAVRMFEAFGNLFGKGKSVKAWSSYVGRCQMCQYEFLHQLNRLAPATEFFTSTGPQNNPLLRPFETDTAYVFWRASGAWKEPYEMMEQTSAPSAPARRLLKDGSALSADKARELSMALYGVVSALPAMGDDNLMGEFFSEGQANALWGLSNLRHYLQRANSTLSSIPADIAGALLADLVRTLDQAAFGDTQNTTAMLRFGHAETLMPLLSLMRLPGCYYLTNYFDTVASHWQDFRVVPMAANLQLVLLKSPSGRLYLLTLLNERPVVFHGLEEVSAGGFMPYARARDYLLAHLPL